MTEAAPGRSSSAVDTTGTIKTDDSVPRLGNEVAAVTEGAW